MKGTKKVLVCITPQSNSVRLIQKGHEIATTIGAELHILHVEKGDSILVNSDSTALLQHLFDYGSELNGIVHGLCGEDVVETIIAFIKSEGITNVLLGEPPKDTAIKPIDVKAKLTAEMPYLHIAELTREA